MIRCDMWEVVYRDLKTNNIECCYFSQRSQARNFASMVYMIQGNDSVELMSKLVVVETKY